MIKTFVGPMFSGKSDALIGIYNKIWNKDLVCAFKPNKDGRDGDEIKSKNYEITIPAICIDDVGEIKNYVINNNIHTIFIDEAQMLQGDVTELVDLSVLFDIDIYIAGLNMTGEQKPFEMMGHILAISDSIETINGFCQECNKPSVYSLYIGDDALPEVLIGDQYYVSLCPRCLKRHKELRRGLK